jgi:flagellar protein FlaH
MAETKVRVLLVEDSPYDAAIVQRMLHKDQSLDFDVEWAQSAGECLEQLKEKTFDILLLDYNLPGQDGLALLQSLSGKPNMPPIIMLSGWGDGRVAEQAMRCGAYSYFPKNFLNSDVLAPKIREALGSNRQEREEKRPADRVEGPPQPPAGETDVTSDARDGEKPLGHEPQGRSESPAETDVASDAGNRRIVSTGNEILDYRMGGGIPVGSLTLIEGQSGAGKSVLAQHLIWGALKNESQVVLYTNENTSESLLTQMASLGMDVADYAVRGKLQVYGMPTSSAGEKASPNLDMLLGHMSQLQDHDLLVVDSLTGFVANLSDQEVSSFLTRCKQYYGQGKTVVAAIHSNAFSDSSLSRIVSLCDVYLRLGIDVMGDRLVKRLEVAKIRGASKVTGRIITFDVEPGLGIVPTVVMTKVHA